MTWRFFKKKSCTKKEEEEVVYDEIRYHVYWINRSNDQLDQLQETNLIRCRLFIYAIQPWSWENWIDFTNV